MRYRVLPLVVVLCLLASSLFFLDPGELWDAFLGLYCCFAPVAFMYGAGLLMKQFGWPALARAYPSPGQVRGRCWSGITGKIGVRFYRWLTLTANQDGFELAIAFIPSFLWVPNIFVPWEEIQGVTWETRFWNRRVGRLVTRRRPDIPIVLPEWVLLQIETKLDLRLWDD